MKMNLLGIDTGGTFTDFVHYDGETLRTHKVLSTPEAPERAILKGVEEMGIDCTGLRVVHGSTIATNAALEGKGARTVYVTNRGLGDVLTIGRQARRELYNLQPQPIPAPVPAGLCLETGGRLSAQGEVLEDLTDPDLEELRHAMERLQPDAVAVNLLFSFLDDRFERRIAAIVPEGIFVSLSSRVLPEFREYERGITTWLNACLGPRVQGYLARLEKGLAPARISVMRSSGDTCSAAQAGSEAVHLLLSGPAGGLNGARFIGEQAGESRILTFDMGGTSTDVALIDGDIRLTGEGRMGPYPVGVPMVDMHTIGAGGGSIAYVDSGGVLQVGPLSAGASPGPACYGAGGERPTVTDANLVLGHLPATAVLAGGMRLRAEQARQVILKLARDLGTASVEEAARGVIRIANEHMVRALRVISVRKGIDPRDFVLFAFGGAGGMHVCALAEALDMNRAIIPGAAGVLSALGMLTAPSGRQLSRSQGRLLDETDAAAIAAEIEQLRTQGMAALKEEGISEKEVRVEPALDLCYRGQTLSLTLPGSDPEEVAPRFHDAHERRFGHRLEQPVELVNVRLSLRTPRRELRMPRAAAGDTLSAAEYGTVAGIADRVPVYRRDTLPVNRPIDGPVLITDAVASSWIAPGWQVRIDGFGNLQLRRSV